MSDQFFKNPIRNSPYAIPSEHWELDKDGQPTDNLISKRRSAKFVTPIPKPKKRQAQGTIFADQELSTDAQQYEKMSFFIESIREKVSEWRSLPNPESWRVTPETARLLQHWRNHPFAGIKPFFCQIEAVETANY